MNFCFRLVLLSRCGERSFILSIFPRSQSRQFTGHTQLQRFHHRLLISSSSSPPLPTSYIAKLTAGDVNQVVSVSNNRIVIGAYGYDNNRGAAFRIWRSE
jgi:hypothetical protein